MVHMDDFKPVRVSTDHQFRARRNWLEIADGAWWKVRDVPDEVFSADNVQNKKIRAAVRMWGARHGYAVESRTERKGKELFLRLTRSAS